MATPLRIAVVGSGPAGLYAVGHLLNSLGEHVEIDLFERLPTPWGLVRAGVAPDHPEKKSVAPNLFDFYFNDRRVRFIGNIEVGTHVAHEELATWYNAVIYAVGAQQDAKLNIPGEAMPGSWSAREFVAWYNGHPDFANLSFDLSSDRAVIVGNGNVALDMARILMLQLAKLRATDIADHALEALATSNIRDVVILGRRGPEVAAYNAPELEELGYLDDVSISAEGCDTITNELLNGADWGARRKLTILKSLSERVPDKTGKRIIFRFFSSPVELLGDGHVEQIVVAARNPGADRNPSAAGKDPASSPQTSIATGLVLRAIGYRGESFPGLPFDERRGIVENSKGRVTAQGKVLPGVYVTGWIKRGPRGVIGSNKKCAHESVDCMLQDYRDGRLSKRAKDADEVMQILCGRQNRIVSRDGWHAIDTSEKEAGHSQGRPRVKIIDRQLLLETAQTG